jgi:sugar O-acyltransferase (sialic acid O-acetyltransferase NeuD family)
MTTATPVLILGAGGLGRELFFWAKECGYAPIGFIDDNPHALDAYTGYPPIVGSITTAPLTAPILCGIGQNPIRIRCVKTLKKRGAIFASCIHPQAKILNASLGEGAIIGPFAYIGADTKIGDFLFLQMHGLIGHDVQGGDFIRVDVGAFIGGYATLGKHVTIYTHAKVMPSKHIGNNVTIGAGSLVLNNLPDDVTVFGSPAMKI